MPNELPDNIVPHLQSVNQKMFYGQAPLDFWQLDDDQSVTDGFMELAAILELAVLEGEFPEKWPNGYRMIMVLFSWEGSAQSDGWSQYFEASDEQLTGVCSLYKFVDLPEEAEAITRAHEVLRLAQLLREESRLITAT